MIKQQSTLADTLNEAPFSPFHLRVAAATAIGFFAASYNLFITNPLPSPFQADPTTTNMLKSMPLIASFLGAIIFGLLADRLGRRALYGFQAIAMAVLALLAAFSPTMLLLIISRSLLGFVIGGIYPVVAVLTSEYANAKDRGRLIGIVFLMQGVAYVTAWIITLLFLYLNLPNETAWRLLLGLGAVPALAAFVAYLKLPESPRFVSRVQHRSRQAADSLQRFSKGRLIAPPANETLQRPLPSLTRYIMPLIGTAGTWFLLDYAYYGNTDSEPLILKAVTKGASLTTPSSILLTNTWWSLAIFLVGAIPGYLLAMNMADRLGHKTLQIIGFVGMGLAFLAIGVIPGITQTFVPFLLVFSLSYFFIQFGPNTTTFILPAELFPINRRATAFGIAAGIGKLGAGIAVFLFPIIKDLQTVVIIAAVFSVLGALLTLIIREPAGKSLEEMAGEQLQATPPGTVPTAASLRPPARVI